MMPIWRGIGRSLGDRLDLRSSNCRKSRASDGLFGTSYSSTWTLRPFGKCPFTIPPHRENGHWPLNQLACQGWEAFKPPFRPAEINDHIVGLGIAGFRQSFAERGDYAGRFGRRAAAEKPNHRHLCLLRARRERPRRRAAEKANELTSPHIRTQAQGTAIVSA